MRNNYLQQEKIEENKSTENDLSSAASGCIVMELYYGKCLACVCCGDCFENYSSFHLKGLIRTSVASYFYKITCTLEFQVIAQASLSRKVQSPEFNKQARLLANVVSFISFWKRY
ncbi:hypothetical protein ACET3Z_015756 [Daucus carota]